MAKKKHADRPPRRDPQPHHANGSAAPVADRPQEGPAGDAEQKRKRRKKKKKKPGQAGSPGDAQHTAPAE